jgi:hypothetical protein
MEKLLRTIFEVSPNKPIITYNGKCAGCKVAVAIDIISY